MDPARILVAEAAVSKGRWPDLIALGSGDDPLAVEKSRRLAADALIPALRSQRLPDSFTDGQIVNDALYAERPQADALVTDRPAFCWAW
jgi:hypothetical protein